MVNKPSKEALVLLEALSSVVAVCAIPAVFLAYMGAHLAFFGDRDVITADEVQDYWTCVTTLTVAVVATFVLAALRRARGALVWHAAVALLGVLVAVVCSVTQTGPV
jgi:hypothetical protein